MNAIFLVEIYLFPPVGISGSVMVSRIMSSILTGFPIPLALCHNLAEQSKLIRPTGSNGRLRRAARKGQGYPC